MMLVLGLVPGLLIAALAILLLWRPARAYFFFRGQRLVNCPETAAPAAVRVDARRAALHGGKADARPALDSCSRWPEREGCGQECAAQVAADPAGTRVTDIVSRWYTGKRCALCDAPFEALNWPDRRAALRSPEGVTLEWPDVPAERLPELFTSHQPVCWPCHLAESFRGRHPELVTDRPEH